MSRKERFDRLRPKCRKAWHDLQIVRELASRSQVALCDDEAERALDLARRSYRVAREACETLERERDSQMKRASLN